MKKLGLFITSAFLLAACGGQQPSPVSEESSKPVESSQIIESSDVISEQSEESEPVESSDEKLSSDEVIESSDEIVESSEEVEPMTPEEAINAVAGCWGAQPVVVEEGVFGAFGAFPADDYPAETMKQYVTYAFTPDEFELVVDWEFEDDVWECFYLNEVDTALEYYVYEKTIYLDGEGMIHYDEDSEFSPVLATFIEVYSYTYVEPEIEPLVINVENLLGYVGSNIVYGDGEVLIDDITFSYIECAAYGNGIQMRTKNGKSSTIMNVDELLLPLKSIDIKLNDGKQVYDNEHALTFTFGAVAEDLGNEVTLDTVADQLEYTVMVPEEVEAYFFKLQHSFNYSLYVDSITLNF